MKIIYFTRPYAAYNSANYQCDIIHYLGKKFDLTVKVLETSYGVPSGELITKNYQNNLIDQANCYDLVVLGHNLLGDHPTENIIPYGLEFLNKIKIAKVAFIQKEYARLKDKLEFFKKIRIKILISHLGDVSKIKLKDYNPKVIFIPFGFDPIVFNKNNQLSKKWDLCFSGVLENPTWPDEQKNYRTETMSKLFMTLNGIKILKKTPARIFWNSVLPGQKIKNTLNRYKRLDPIDYYKMLSQSKFTLCTTSCGLITPRFFESMASGSTPITFPNQEINQITGLNKKVCVVNNPDELISRILEKQYPSSEEVIEYAHSNHTWENRINLLGKELKL